MCGRYTVTHPSSDLATELGLELADDVAIAKPRYNVAPTQPVPIILERKTRGARAVRWGLIPSWTTDAKRSPLLINARAETVAQKPAFREALKLQRCLVLADGFYEWRMENGSKQPYYIRLRGGRPFAFAGLWDTWRAKPDGVLVPSCTIITVAPNALVADIHDRMPAILPREAYDRWLSPQVTDPAAVLPMLRAYPAEEMEAFRVSARVGSVQNDDAELIAPLP